MKAKLSTRAPSGRHEWCVRDPNGEQSKGMGEYDESDCKPMADIKRERHCSDSKRHGIHGKTVKKRQDAGSCFSARVDG